MAITGPHPFAPEEFDALVELIKGLVTAQHVRGHVGNESLHADRIERQTVCVARELLVDPYKGME